MRDLYILDQQYRRIAVYDTYESLIWTERFTAFGDFELTTAASREVLSLFPTGTKLSILDSERLMVVETHERGVNDEGVDTIVIKGSSFEKVLADRGTFWAPVAGTQAPPATLTFTDVDPRYVVAKVVGDRCVNATQTPADKIPYLSASNLIFQGSIPPAISPVTVTVGPQNLYDWVQQMCVVYGMGFKISFIGDGTLAFKIYTGDDHTSTQSTHHAVVFGTALDTLASPSEFTSVSDFKNVAYVYAKNGMRTVYADNVDPAISGTERRALYIDASDIDLPLGAALDAAIDLRGRQELAKHRAIKAFDGEIPQYSVYQYGVDYNLGDLVETRNNDGLTNNMRVTEQIFVSDKEGDRSYPTLSLDTLITPGTWLAWDSSQVWADAPGYWSQAGG